MPNNSVIEPPPIQAPASGSFGGVANPSTSGATMLTPLKIAVINNVLNPGPELKIDADIKTLPLVYDNSIVVDTVFGNSVMGMPMADFHNSFFGSPNGFFNINPFTSNHTIGELTSYTYVTKNNINGNNTKTVNNLSIYNLMLGTYLENKNIPLSRVPTSKLILLQRELRPLSNLSNWSGTVYANRYCDVVDRVINDYNIIPILDSSNISQSQGPVVPLEIDLICTSSVLDITVNITLTFNVCFIGFTHVDNPIDGFTETGLASLSYGVIKKEGQLESGISNMSGSGLNVL
jgi:hypothetical protein